jgi:hypothetical protein
VLLPVLLDGSNPFLGERAFPTFRAAAQVESGSATVAAPLLFSNLNFPS